MKWILIIVLISAIMLIAFSLSEQIKDRHDFYQNLKLFLNQFKINISFRQEKILDFLKKTNSKKQFKLFVQEYESYLKTASMNLEKIKVLDQEDREILLDIMKNIGRYDVRNELGQIDSFLATIDVKLKKALDDKNKLSPMILKLSLLFAIGLAILLI